MENGSENAVIAFIPSSHQTDLSAIYSGPKVMILSCPDHVHLICINDHSSLSVCLNLLICKLTTNDITVCDIACCVQNKDYLLTYLLSYWPVLVVELTAVRPEPRIGCDCAATHCRGWWPSHRQQSGLLSRNYRWVWFVHSYNHGRKVAI